MGKSLSESVQSLEKKGFRPHRVTAWRWNRDYGSLLKKMCDEIAPRTGYVWSADETYVKAKGKGELAVPGG